MASTPELPRWATLEQRSQPPAEEAVSPLANEGRRRQGTPSGDLRGHAVADQRFQLRNLLGSGSFGRVYAGTDSRTGEDVAVKLEPSFATQPQLQYEAKIYKILAGGKGIPKIHWCGQEGIHSILVLELLGPSLEQAFVSSGRKMGLDAITKVAQQTLECLEYIHEVGFFVHRDIKPHNIVFGRGAKADQVFLIDFGLAKRYRHPKTMEHITYRDNKRTFTGNYAFAAVNSHLGIEACRRDDIDALGYMLVYLHRGHLPWQHVQGGLTEKEVIEMKKNISVQSLCEKCPPECAEFMSYSQRLSFEDRPDYAHLGRLLRGPASGSAGPSGRQAVPVPPPGSNTGFRRTGLAPPPNTAPAAPVADTAAEGGGVDSAFQVSGLQGHEERKEEKEAAWKTRMRLLGPSLPLGPPARPSLPHLRFCGGGGSNTRRSSQPAQTSRFQSIPTPLSLSCLGDDTPSHRGSVDSNGTNVADAGCRSYGSGWRSPETDCDRLSFATCFSARNSQRSSSYTSHSHRTRSARKGSGNECNRERSRTSTAVTALQEEGLAQCDLIFDDNTPTDVEGLARRHSSRCDGVEVAADGFLPILKQVPMQEEESIN